MIERHRIHSAPQPRSRPTTLFPSASTRRSHARSASLPAHLHALPSYSNLLVPAWNPLSVEELALLPLCALPAHRAVRTFADVIAPPKSSRSPSLVNGDAKAAAAAAAAGSGGGVGGNGGNSSGSGTNAVCILVLNGNDGPGAMALQMLSRRGVRVSVQVPDSAVRSSMEDEDLYSQTEDESSLGIRLSPSKQSNKSPQKSSLLSSPSSPSSPSPPRAMPRKTLYERVEARLKAWGAQEICVGEPLRVIEGLVQDGRAFDGVLDTVGGVEVWEGSQRLLLADPMFDPVRNPPTSPVSPAGSEMSEGGGGGNVYGGRGSSRRGGGKGRGGGGGISQAQFTTLVGDNPARPIPSAHDNFRSGFRSLKRSVSRSVPSSANTSPAKSTVGLPISSSRESFSTLLRKNSLRGGGGRGGGGGGEVKSKKKRIVNYTWVSVSADVDFEGEDVRDSLGAVVGMVEEGWIRPWIDESEGGGGGVVMEMGETRNKLDKIVPFEKSPEVFRRDATGPVGLLKDGGTCVVKIAG